MKRTRRKLAALVGAALLAFVVLAGGLAPAASAQSQAEVDEWEFVCRINAERRRWGIPDLQVTNGLRTVARDWAAHLRGINRLEHRPNLGHVVSTQVTSSWSGVGENVGYGLSVGSLHNAFMNSPGHRANILNRSYRYIGVGVAHGSYWRWTTHNFLATGTNLSTVSNPVHSFRDVCMSNQFFSDIEWMSSRGISTGWSDRTYRPGAPVTRQSMSAFMYRLAGSPNQTFPNPGFPDVPPTAPFFREISWMATTGITTGYPDGTFRPQGRVSREAMSAFMYRFAGAQTTATGTIFRDVPRSHAFADEIAWMSQRGITTGYDDGTYRPGAPVTRQAMSAFMRRLDGIL